MRQLTAEEEIKFQEFIRTIQEETNIAKEDVQEDIAGTTRIENVPFEE